VGCDHGQLGVGGVPLRGLAGQLLHSVRSAALFRSVQETTLSDRAPR
jgi:hypothetical protein